MNCISVCSDSLINLVIVDTGAEANEETIMQNKVINEEYKIWKKNAPYLYDTMFRYGYEYARPVFL